MMRTPVMLAVAALAAAGSSALQAQERLLAGRVASASVVFDQVRFGSEGLAFTSASGLGTERVDRATVLTVPLSLAVPLGDRVTFDIAAAYTRGEVAFAERAQASLPATVRLDGLTDVRVRATARLLGDNVLLTLGGNLPTGAVELDADQIAALSVLGAPALAVALPAVSFGPGGSTGIVVAKAQGNWAFAAAASYEVRGKFSPVAALTAGISTPEFEPGNAIHVTLSTDGAVGQGALNVTVTGDIYTQDHLVAGAGSSAASSVKLGPTLGADMRWRIPARRFSELVFFVGDHYRAAFERNGATVDQTSGNYLSAGLSGDLPISTSTAVTGGIEFWNHSGLAVDNSLVTAATSSGALTLGLSQRMGAYELRPFVRGRAGSIDTGLESRSVSGWSAGIALTARF